MSGRRPHVKYEESEYDQETSYLLDEQTIREDQFPNDPSRLQTFADIDELIGETTWLWQDWIPRGAITAIIGAPGTYKSFFAMRLCKTILYGGEWPDRTVCDAPDRESYVLWCESESSERMNVERSKHLGIEGERFRCIAIGKNYPESFSLFNADHRERVSNALTDPLCLGVVVDSFSRSMTEGSENNNNDMNKALSWLSDAARDHAKWAIILHHTHKSVWDSSKARPSDARGGGAFSGIMRSIIHTLKPSSDSSTVRLERGKCNLAGAVEACGAQIIDGKRLEWCAAPEMPSDSLNGAMSVQDMKIQELTAQGLSTRKIGLALDKSHEWVRKRQQALDIQPPSTPSERLTVDRARYANGVHS